MTVATIEQDTIAAIATAPGRAGIGVVRISGPAAAAIGAGLTGKRPPSRRATLSIARDQHGHTIDRGILVFFRGPASFTGEDVVEFQGHGGDAVLAMIIERVVELGARMARPGEFSERSFLNGKIDLAQAEAIADLINGATRQAVLGAARSLSGEFSDLVHEADRGILELRMHVEGAIDFPDDDTDFLATAQFFEQTERLVLKLEALIEQTRVGTLLNNGLHVALVGRPNVGKSSLLNRLAKTERAIVTDVPGTTRDTLDVDFQIEGLPVRVVDTAGLRETTDPVEVAGVARTKAAVAQADLVLWVADASEGFERADFESIPIDRSVIPSVMPETSVLKVLNKVDLTQLSERTFGYDSERGVVRVSAVTGEGLDGLRAAILGAANFQSGEGAFTARQRHVDALAQALGALRSASRIAAEPGGAFPELIAEELRAAHQALGTIVGVISADDLLGEIFSSFCIGK